MPTMSVKQRTSDIAIENADVRFSPITALTWTL